MGLNLRFDRRQHSAARRQDQDCCLPRRSGPRESGLNRHRLLPRNRRIVRRWRQHGCDLGNLEAGDQIRVQGRIENALPLFQRRSPSPQKRQSIWVTKELGAGTSGASGQESEAAANNGNSFIRLYRKVEADGGIPADPGPAYTGGEYVALTAFGLWKVDPPTLSGTQVLWVANGGTVLDSGGNVQNRALADIRFTRSSSTRSIDSGQRYLQPRRWTADSRFVRSFTTNGAWGAWKRIEDGTERMGGPGDERARRITQSIRQRLCITHGIDW